MNWFSFEQYNVSYGIFYFFEFSITQYKPSPWHVFLILSLQKLFVQSYGHVICLVNPAQCAQIFIRCVMDFNGTLLVYSGNQHFRHTLQVYCIETCVRFLGLTEQVLVIERHVRRLPSLTRPGVEVTKMISSVLLFSEFFAIVKTYVSCWISRLYLTGVAAAQLRGHMSNMNVI